LGWHDFVVVDVESLVVEVAQLRALLADASGQLADQAAAIEELQAINARLESQNAELRRRLGLNSRNSSKPPSSDGLAKPPPRSLRKSSGRAPGKQPGSPGVTLRQADNPDEVFEHRPARCSGCHADLATAPVTSVARRQVFDIAPIRVRVIEHRLMACQCDGCGRVTSAPAVGGVAGPVQYGPGIAAVVVYLAVRQHVPTQRIAELCAQVLGISVSTGWITARLRGAAAALTGFAEHLTAGLRDARVAHFDESGARVAGRLRWVHSASTATLTGYHLDDKRGRTAMDAAAILPGFTGIAVHDCWAAYFSYVHAEHAICNAHILRELIGWHETEPQRQRWAKDAIEVLLDANRAVAQTKAAGRDRLDPAQLAAFDQRWSEAITAGYTANPRPEAGRGNRIVALIDRLRTATTEIWRFTRNFAVPFDNNQAERDIRMVKLQIKISGGWRTTDGARDWLTIRSYISTVTKNGLNVLQALHDALTGNPWLPPQPTTT
jgi:transposase